MNRMALSLFAVLAAGCSTAAKDISPSYASSAPYEGYTCAQLASETARMNWKIDALGRRLDDAARNDKGIAVVGALFFWPALLALGGTKEEEIEYSRMVGQRDALRQIAAARGCDGGLETAASAF
jgi:hypothetical protein